MTPLFNRRPRPSQISVESLPDEVKALVATLESERAETARMLERLKEAAAQFAPVEDGIQRAEARQAELAARLDESAEQAAQTQRLAEQAATVERERAEQAAAAERERAKQAAAVEREMAEQSAAIGRQVAERAAAAEKQMTQLRRGQDEANQRMQEMVANLRELSVTAIDLRKGVQEALRLRQEMAELSGPSGLMQDLSAKADELRETFLNYNHDVQTARERQDEIFRMQEAANRSMAESGSFTERLKQDIEAAASRLATMESGLAEVAKLEGRMARTEEQLHQLGTLADHVTHKARSLEAQQVAVERAAAQAARLDDLVWDLDGRLKKLQEDTKRIRKTQDQLADIGVMYEQSQAQLGQLKTDQAAAAEETRQQAERLGRLRGEVREDLDKLDRHRAGLDAMARQVGEVRSSVLELEQQLHGIDEARRSINQGHREANDLQARLTAVTADVRRVEQQAERVQGLPTALAEAERQMEELQARLADLVSARPAMDELRRDVDALKADREAVQAAREQLLVAHNDLERWRETEAELERAAADLESRLASVTAQIAAVDQSALRVERARGTAEKALAAAQTLATRETFLKDVEARFDRLGALSTELNQRLAALEERRGAFTEMEERIGAVTDRLDDADTRFRVVSQRADDVGRIERQIQKATADVQGNEQRVAALRAGLTDLTAHTERVEQIARETEALGRELESRGASLDEARAKLERAAALREETARAVVELERQQRELANALTAARSEADRVSLLAEQLEARAGNLRFADKRITQFEEKLKQLEQMEQHVQTTVASLTARSESVDAVRKELVGIFQTAHDTVARVQEIAGAQQEVRDAKAALEAILNRSRELDGLMQSVDDRWSRVTQAEERLARLNALLADVQSSLETLRGQRAMIDHAIDKTSQLTYEVKEAEAMLARLREERELAGKIHEAVQELRSEERAS